MDTKLLQVFFLITIGTKICVYCIRKNEGDGCVLRDGTSGVCKKLPECRIAQVAVANNVRPVICLGKKIPIVCCENQTLASTIRGSAKHKEKCVAYGEAVFEVEESYSLLGETYTERTPVCAQAAQELIIGGTACQPKEFPHMAALGYGDEADKKWLCGGSLVSERYILTAAHCVFSQELGKVKWALLGDLNYENDDDDAEPMLTEVRETIKHPDYRSSSLYNDIALLKLKEDVVFNSFVRPACLNSNSATPVNQSVVATGWGMLQHDSQDVSPNLMKVTLRVAESSRCRETYSSVQKIGSKLSRGIDEAMMMCVGDVRGENGTWKDTCGGDSGGPLQMNIENPYCMYSIVGVTSFGNAACGISPAPAVYTRVSYFVPWIESIVWPN